MLRPTAYIVLGLLDRLGEASPYDLKQAAKETLGNFWSTPHSQIYRTVEQLAAGGMVTGRVETTPGGRHRTSTAYLRPAARRCRSGVVNRWRSCPSCAIPRC